MLKDLKKFSAALLVTIVIRTRPLLNIGLFGLVENWLKMISACLLLPLYFCFTILIELMSEMSL